MHAETDQWAAYDRARLMPNTRIVCDRGYSAERYGSSSNTLKLWNAILRYLEITQRNPKSCETFALIVHHIEVAKLRPTQREFPLAPNSKRGSEWVRFGSQAMNSQIQQRKIVNLRSYIFLFSCSDFSRQATQRSLTDAEPETRCFYLPLPAGYRCRKVTFFGLGNLRCKAIVEWGKKYLTSINASPSRLHVVYPFSTIKKGWTQVERGWYKIQPSKHTIPGYWWSRYGNAVPFKQKFEF